MVLVCIFYFLSFQQKNFNSVSEAELDYEYTRHATKIWLCDRIVMYTWSNIITKTMLRIVRNVLFQHDIAHVASGGCIFIIH